MNDEDFTQQSNEDEASYYTRIDETEDHPVVGPALRKMMNKYAGKFPPFKERAEKLGLDSTAKLIDVFVMSLLASALSGSGEARDIIIDRLDGRIINAAPPAPKRKNGNGTKNSLENLTDDQLSKMIDKEVNGSPDSK